MTFQLTDVQTGKQAVPPRIILLGEEGVGKSTFASQAPNCLFIPIKGEEGIHQIDVARTPTVENLGQLEEILTALVTEDHDYKTVVVDSTSALEPIIEQAVVAEHGATNIEGVMGGYGKGFTLMVNKWEALSRAFDMLRDKGVMVVLIGHVDQKRVNDPMLEEEYERFQWSLRKGSVATLSRWADALLFARFKVLVRKNKSDGQNKKTGVGGERALYTESRPGHPGKNRYGLPYELPLEWRAFQDALAQAMAK